MKARKFTINDNVREQWIANDAALYHWWLSSRLAKRTFVTRNRQEIDAHINAALAPREKTWRDYR